jgi:CRP/FNR family cyclic AMP-dependent transcriptional regulator
MEESAKRLRGVSIFGALTPETIEFLLHRATRQETHAGDFLVREGEPGGDLYVLESGSAEVFKERKGAKSIKVRLAKLVAGDCFGETSLLACMPRSATVVALTDCVTLRLATNDLLALYEQDVRQFAILMMNLGREAARRLWISNELLLDRILG